MLGAVIVIVNRVIRFHIARAGGAVKPVQEDVRLSLVDGGPFLVDYQPAGVDGGGIRAGVLYLNDILLAVNEGSQNFRCAPVRTRWNG